MTEWEAWVRHITGGATSRQVGAKIGHSHTTALKWMHDPVSPEAVITLARAYHADLLRAFVAAGWLDEKDLQLTMDEALQKVASVKLTAELHRRAVRAYEKLRAEVDKDVFDEHRENGGGT